MIEERGSGNVLQATYTHGPGIDENLTMTRGGQTYYYFHDGLGSVTDLAKNTGELVESYQYDVYGQPTTPSTVGNPYLFTGREYDSETGLYYSRARYYSPSIGRFLQRDPVGYVVGMNLYSYGHNSPLIWIDPSGLLTFIVHGAGRHEKGYSGALGDFLRSKGEYVVEYYWSGGIFDFQEQSFVIRNLSGMLGNARRLAEARGERLNIISHSQGTRIAYKAVSRSNVKVDNLVTLGSPYASQYSRPGNVVHWVNVWSQQDPVSYPSAVTGGYDVRIDSRHEEYWNQTELNPQLQDLVSDLMFNETPIKKRGRE